MSNTSETIKPAIGDDVLYCPSDWDLIRKDAPHLMITSDIFKPMLARITYVWHDRMVNLVVVDHEGRTHGRTSVPLVQFEENTTRAGGFCWYPVQAAPVAAPATATEIDAAWSKAVGELKKHLDMRLDSLVGVLGTRINAVGRDVNSVGRDVANLVGVTNEIADKQDGMDEDLGEIHDAVVGGPDIEADDDYDDLFELGLAAMHTLVAAGVPNMLQTVDLEDGRRITLRIDVSEPEQCERCACALQEDACDKMAGLPVVGDFWDEPKVVVTGLDYFDGRSDGPPYVIFLHSDSMHEFGRTGDQRGSSCLY